MWPTDISLSSLIAAVLHIALSQLCQTKCTAQWHHRGTQVACAMTSQSGPRATTAQATNPPGTKGCATSEPEHTRSDLLQAAQTHPRGYPNMLQIHSTYLRHNCPRHCKC